MTDVMPAYKGSKLYLVENIYDEFGNKLLGEGYEVTSKVSTK
jgi:hypothetical protein